MLTFFSCCCLFLKLWHDAIHCRFVYTASVYVDHWSVFTFSQECTVVQPLLFVWDAFAVCWYGDIPADNIIIMMATTFAYAVDQLALANCWWRTIGLTVALDIHQNSRWQVHYRFVPYRKLENIRVENISCKKISCKKIFVVTGGLNFYHVGRRAGWEIKRGGVRRRLLHSPLRCI